MVHDTEWSQSWFDQGHFFKTENYVFWPQFNLKTQLWETLGDTIRPVLNSTLNKLDKILTAVYRIYYLLPQLSNKSRIYKKIMVSRRNPETK